MVVAAMCCGWCFQVGARRSISLLCLETRIFGGNTESIDAEELIAKYVESFFSIVCESVDAIQSNRGVAARDALWTL